MKAATDVKSTHALLAALLMASACCAADVGPLPRTNGAHETVADHSPPWRKH